MFINEVFQAYNNIQCSIIYTPLRYSNSLSLDSHKVYLKLESHQLTGSFKLRGASNAVQKILHASKKNHNSLPVVVGVSTGNHGKGLAYAAKNAGIKSIICMSNLVPKNKVEAISALGAEVSIIGQSQDDAQQEADRLVAEENMQLLPPFDHQDVIAGQATIGLELIKQMPGIDNIIVPLSGGGLISGVAFFLKSINPQVKVFGVTMERGCAMFQSIQHGRPTQVKEYLSIADSLGGGIGLHNQFTFSMVQKYVDDIVLVSERDIASAISHAYWHEQEILEGSGAVGIAAILSKKLSLTGTTVIIASGRNIDMSLHQDIVTDKIDFAKYEMI